MKKTRVWLFLSSCLVLALVVGWLLLVIHFQPPALRPMLVRALCFLGLAAGAGMALFCLKGPIFYHDGGLRRRSIAAVLAILLCMVQVAMTFTIFFWQYVSFIQDTRLEANAVFQAARPALSASRPELGGFLTGDAFSALHVLSAKDGVVLASTADGLDGSVMKPDPIMSYRFPDGDVEFVAEISADNRRDGAFSLLLQLFTVAAGSMVMTGEMVILCVALIERRRNRSAPDSQGSDSSDGSGLDAAMMEWLRPLSFLLCFASRLCSSFLPVMAGELPGTVPGFSPQTAAGLPQSAELLLTCAAVLFTPGVMRRFGWKPPFFAGLLIVAAGSLICAGAGSILMLVFGRAVVGLGYGFCWMTLRNMCMMTRDDNAGKLGLLMLVVGIYAGVTCGTALGSLLAELIGFRAVLAISAGLLLLFGLAVTPMRNIVPPSSAPSVRQPVRRGGNKPQWWGAACFLVLMVVPCCIVISFTGTYVPLYFLEIGRSIGDTGSSQLLYGLTIIYFGPFLDRMIGSLRPFACCVLGNLFLIVVLIVFGMRGGFVMALAASVFLGMTEIIGSGAQNFHILSFPLFSRLEKITAFTLLSLFKKFFEAIGPTAFAFAAGFGTEGVTAMGKVFLAGLALYVFGSFVGRMKKLA